MRLCDVFDVTMVYTYPHRTVAEYLQMHRRISLGYSLAQTILVSTQHLPRATSQDLDADGFVRLVAQVHRVIFSDAFGPDAGRFRMPGQEVVVGGEGAHSFHGLPPEEIEGGLRRVWGEFAPPRLAKLGDVDSTARWAARFCQGFFRVHPFCDGNGRTARLFVEMVAVSRGLAIEWPTFARRRHLTRDRRRYLAALEHAHMHRQLTQAGRVDVVVGRTLEPIADPEGLLAAWWKARLRVDVTEVPEDEDWRQGDPDGQVDLTAILTTAAELTRGSALPASVMNVRLPYEPPPRKKHVRHRDKTG